MLRFESVVELFDNLLMGVLGVYIVVFLPSVMLNLYASWIRPILLSRAAEQGCAEAQFNLGRCYFYGKGVGLDYAKAAELYRKAAEQGYAEAQYNLGYCYYNGYGVPKNMTKVVEWNCKAATDDAVKASKGSFKMWGRRCRGGHARWCGSREQSIKHGDSFVRYVKEAGAYSADAVKAIARNADDVVRYTAKYGDDAVTLAGKAPGTFMHGIALDKNIRLPCNRTESKGITRV